MRLGFSIILLLYTLLNWLVGRQILDLLKVNKIAFWVVFIILAYSPLLTRLGWVKFLNVFGNYWMVFFYYAVLVAFIGLFIKNTPFIVGCYVLIFIAIIYGVVHAKEIKLQPYEIVIPKKASDLHVVMLADIHIDSAKGSNYVDKMVQDINALQPDLVLLAGDIFDDRDITILKKQKETLQAIRAKYGVYGVLGNHEYYSGNLDEMIKTFQEANIKILKDEVAEVAGVYLVGREDAHKTRKSLKELLHTVDLEKPIILLDHQPVALEEARENGVDLQLSGHTHRGQFFPNQLITKRIYEIDYGYLAKGNLQVIVSSGYGTWGPPVRIGTQSEIVDIKMKFAQ